MTDRKSRLSLAIWLGNAMGIRHTRAFRWGGLAFVLLLLWSYSPAAHLLGIRAGLSAGAHGGVSLRLLIDTDAPAGQELRVTVPSNRGENTWSFLTDSQGKVDTGYLYADGSAGGQVTVSLLWDDSREPSTCTLPMGNISAPAEQPGLVRCAGLLRVPQDFATLAQAIAAAQGGETLLINAGRYLENLTIPVDLTVKSQSGSQVILQGTSAEQPVITIGSARVRLSGLTVQLGDDSSTVPAVLAAGGAELTLEQSVIAGAAGPALELGGVAQGHVTSSRLSSDGAVALRVEGAAQLFLSQCEISGSNFAGLFISDQAQVMVSNCDFVRHLGNALLVEGSAAATVRENTFSGNNQAVELLGDASASLEGNTLTQNQQGLRIGGAAQAAVTANRIFGNRQNGILLAEGARALIWNNDVTDNGGWGVALYRRPCVETEADFSGQVSGAGNRITDNSSGDLCPPADQYPWPPGFRKNP